MKGLIAISMMLFSTWSLFISQHAWAGFFPTLHDALRRGQAVSRHWHQAAAPYQVLRRQHIPHRKLVGRKRPTAKAVRYTYHRLLNRSVHVVRINLDHPQVRLQLQLAKGGLGRTESFQSMIKRTKPLAAIDAAFFSLKNMHPVGNMGMNGTLITQAPAQQPGTTLTVSGRNDIEISRGQAFSLHYILNQGREWREKPARNYVLGLNTPLEERMPKDTIKVYTRDYGPIVDIGPFGRAVIVENGRVKERLSGPRIVIPANGFVVAGLGNSVFTKIERMYEGEALRMLYWDIRRRKFATPRSMMIGAGPKLLARGRIVVDARAEGFRHSHIYMNMSRAALGLTENGRTMLLVTIPGGASLRDEARIVQALGCYEAMNLDGGASTALYALGRTITAPSRPLTNLLVIKAEGKPVGAAR